MINRNKHIGSSLESLFEELGELEEVKTMSEEMESKDIKPEVVQLNTDLIDINCTVCKRTMQVNGFFEGFKFYCGDCSYPPEPCETCEKITCGGECCNCEYCKQRRNEPVKLECVSCGEQNVISSNSKLINFEYGVQDKVILLRATVDIHNCGTCDMKWLDHTAEDAKRNAIKQYLK